MSSPAWGAFYEITWPLPLPTAPVLPPPEEQGQTDALSQTGGDDRGSRVASGSGSEQEEEADGRMDERTDRRAGESHIRSVPRAPSCCAGTLTLVMRGGDDGEIWEKGLREPLCYLQLFRKSKSNLK